MKPLVSGLKATEPESRVLNAFPAVALPYVSPAVRFPKSSLGQTLGRANLSP